jgi:integrase
VGAFAVKAGAGHVECHRKQWYLRVRSKVDGVRRQHRICLGEKSKFRSKAAARVAADAWIARQAPSTLKPGATVTFGEYAQRFIHDYVRLNRKSSQKKYKSNISLLARHLAGDLLASIDAARLQSVITEISQTKARSTVQSIRGLALTILRRARTDGFGAHLVDSKAIRLPQQRQPDKPKRAWSATELEQLLAASRGMWRFLWLVMAYAGLRAGEALGLQWADVDFEKGAILIRRAATQGDLLAPKTATSAAMVPMLPTLIDGLTEYRARWHANDKGLLFPNVKGGVLRADDVRTRKLHPMLAQAGLPVAGLHSFRHTTTRILMDLGLGSDFVRSFMRHGSLRMTERYMHTSAGDLRAALDAAVARNKAQQGQTTGSAL